MAVSPCLSGSPKNHWWLTNRKMVNKYVKEARCLIETQQPKEVLSSLNLLEAAVTLSPHFEPALELKARALLYLRRFKDVADMLQDYIPSLRMSTTNDESGYGSGSVVSDNSREGVKLLPNGDEVDTRFKCFSVTELKKKVMAGLCKDCDREGQWRYLVLGQACLRLGLMEDAMVLLQTGKRLSMAALRRKSNSWSDDSFSVLEGLLPGDKMTQAVPPPPRLLTESENVSQLLSHIKFLLRRKASALAALDAGHYPEAIRHFTKIVDGRRGAPQGFISECYMHRAFAFKSSGRIAEALADCNRTLALEPHCIQALETRAELFEIIRCLPDSLHDLEYLKLLYNTILRDRKLPGPAWKRHNISYREIPGKLCSLTAKSQNLKNRVASGEMRNVDYYALIGLRRGCSRSELERAHLLLSLRHKPDKATNFIERCEFTDDKDIESVKDRAKMSALLLYRLLQRGYSSLMTTIMEEEAAEKQRIKAAAAAALQAAQATTQVQQTTQSSSSSSRISSTQNKLAKSSGTTNASAYKGVFCRDLTAVGNLISQVGFNRPNSVKYEALSC